MTTVTEEDIEEIEMAIEEELMELDADKLQELAAGLNISEERWRGKRKLLVLKSIRRFIEKELEEKKENEEKQEFLNKVMNGLEDLEKRKKRRSPVKSEKKVKGEKKQEAEDSSDKEGNDNVLLANLKVLRKYFIIAGKIGELDNDKDIGYLGIVRQMADQIGRGYPESEVVQQSLKPFLR